MRSGHKDSENNLNKPPLSTERLWRSHEHQTHDPAKKNRREATNETQQTSLGSTRELQKREARVQVLRGGRPCRVRRNQPRLQPSRKAAQQAKLQTRSARVWLGREGWGTEAVNCRLFKMFSQL